MLIPIEFKAILLDLSNDNKLFPTLKKRNIQPIFFFQYLKDNPDAKEEYDLVRQIAVHRELDSMRTKLEKASGKLEFEKAKESLQLTRWEAEKLLPKDYGSRVDINVNKTIDIRAVLIEARKRIALDMPDAVEVEHFVIDPVSGEKVSKV